MLSKLENYGQEGLRTPIRGLDFASNVTDCQDLLSILPGINSPAIISYIDGTNYSITHKELKNFIVHEFNLKNFGNLEELNIILFSIFVKELVMVIALLSWHLTQLSLLFAY